MQEKKQKKTNSFIKHKNLYIMLLPGVIAMIVFCYLPMFGLITVLQDYQILEGVSFSEWVGFKFFKQQIFDMSGKSYMVLRNTLYIALIRIATNFPLVIAFAVFLNHIQLKQLKSFMSTVSYLPYFISWAIVGGMMYGVLNSDTGILKNLFNEIGLPAINFYAEDQYWWAILSVSSLWKTMGWSTLVYMSAMSCINTELYEAVEIDGGGKIRQIFTVTLPGIMNVILLQLILDSANIFKDNYEQILAVTNGSDSLVEKTAVIGSVTYGIIANPGDDSLSTATTIGFIQGVLGFLMVLITNNIAKKTDNEGVL